MRKSTSIRHPLPAALVGLVLFVTVWVADVVLDPANAARGIFIKIAIVIALVGAVSAGLKHRTLKRELEMSPGP